MAAIGADRSNCGDTFVIDSGDDCYLVLFSPQGLREFHDVSERTASKGLADWKMLVRKLPPGGSARCPSGDGGPRCAVRTGALDLRCRC